MRNVVQTCLAADNFLLMRKRNTRDKFLREKRQIASLSEDIH